jgi:O-antigen ligase
MSDPGLAVVLPKDRHSAAAIADRGVAGGSHLLLLTGAWATSGILLYLVLPRAAPLLLPLCVVAPALWQWGTRGSIVWYRPSAVTIVLLLAGLYLLVNGTWSLSRSDAYAEIFCYFLTVVSASATLAALRDTPAAAQRAMAAGLLLAMLIGGVWLCFETFSGQATLRWLISRFPSLSPAPRHMHIAAESLTLEPHLLNFSMTALALLFWPAALALRSLRLPRRATAASLVGLALGAAAIFGSEHGTSKMAMLCAAAAFAGFWVSAKLVRRATLVAWVAVTLLVAPLAIFAYQNELYLSRPLPGSVRQRIVIWGYTSAQILKAPLLGAGVSTARALNTRNDENAPRAPGSKYRLTTGWHSHNAYLQTWYETGAVGALWLLALGLLVLRSLASANAAAQPYLYATFVSCAAIAASSFSLWAPWFMASFAIAAIHAALGEGAGATPPLPIETAAPSANPGRVTPAT